MPLRLQVLSLALVVSLLSVAPALAQGPLDQPSPDRDQVMILTAVVALGLLLAGSVGFLYRRMKGMVPPPEPPSGGEHH